MAFVVTVWNGADYDESDTDVVGAFNTLEQALEYCENTEATHFLYKNTILNPYEAYHITHVEGSKRIAEYNFSGDAVYTY